MINLVEQKGNVCFCNVCQINNKEKYYELRFINPINQDVVIYLCESCLNDRSE